MVFLGDYVDRTPSSWDDRQSAVVVKLLKLKIQYRDRIYMLMGNHDLDPSKYLNFHSEFWFDLNDGEHELFSEVLSALPIVATTSNGVALCHGTLPPNTNFNNFDLHKGSWVDDIWSDYLEDNDIINRSCRPTKCKKYFIKSMAAFDATILIKGHNPFVPITMYDNTCVTIQTTRIYADICGMHIVVIDLTKPIINANDVQIINVNDIK